MQVVRLAISFCVLAGLLVAQPSLRITSPPGAFEVVAIGAPHPLAKDKQVIMTPPYNFTIEVPSGIRPDKYPVTAVGITFSKEFVYSHSVEILVERADSPVSITVYPVVADFTMEQRRYIQVTGLYADKTTADLTQSSRIKYVSSAPGVATVSPQGIVTPVAPGSGKITVTYGDLKVDVPVRVRESER